MKVLVSACLLGESCKYNGGNNYNGAVAEFVRDKEILPICPELMAGMGCPRTPIEIVDGVLMDRDGKNVDTAMREAVEMAMKQLSSEEIQCAVLQSRSPTCGVNQVYDGSFSGKLILGAGMQFPRLCMTAPLLLVWSIRRISSFVIVVDSLFIFLDYLLVV